MHNRFDAGIRAGERIEHDMIAVRIGEPFRLIAAASPDYLAEHPAPLHPRDLRHHRCICYRRDWDGAILRWSFEKDGQRLQEAIEGPLVVNDMDLALRAALDGAGIAFMVEGQALPC